MAETSWFKQTRKTKRVPFLAPLPLRVTTLEWLQTTLTKARVAVKNRGYNVEIFFLSIFKFLGLKKYEFSGIIEFFMLEIDQFFVVE